MKIMKENKKIELTYIDIEKTKKILSKYKIALFIVTYNAEKHIENVLSRVPEEIRNYFVEVYIIDDSSKDLTHQVAIDAGIKLGYKNLNVLRTPFNRGYGGNQKLGYLYAIRRNFDIVILLHGDGQYSPEYLPKIIETFEDITIDVVFASRMINKINALKGGMPFYKWIGNQLLTAIENLVLMTSLSEFHTGYRAYKVETLKQIPFQYNSDDFHFDTEIIIQLIATKKKIKEISIPTIYGNEKCHVNSIKYGLNCLKSIIKYKLVQMGLFYEPNFDFRLFETRRYYLKLAPNTLHQYILAQDWSSYSTIIELGADKGEISAILAQKVNKVTSVDIALPLMAGKAKSKEVDLNNDFDKVLGYKKYDCVIILDVIEHLINPEEAVKKIFNILKPHGTLYASTANVGYFVTRLSLLFGLFNYGKRGILDMTHKRLFTIYSFKKLLTSNGFIIKKVEGFGPPIIDMIGDNFILKLIDSILSKMSKIWTSLFAYNFLIIAERMDGIEDIYEKTFSHNA